MRRWKELKGMQSGPASMVSRYCLAPEHDAASLGLFYVAASLGIVRVRRLLLIRGLKLTAVESGCGADYVAWVHVGEESRFKADVSASGGSRWGVRLDGKGCVKSTKNGAPCSASATVERTLARKRDERRTSLKASERTGITFRPFKSSTKTILDSQNKSSLGGDSRKRAERLRLDCVWDDRDGSSNATATKGADNARIADLLQPYFGPNPMMRTGNLTILLELEGNARILGGRRALCSRISEQKPRWCLEEVVTLQGEVFDNESRPFVRPDGLFDVPPCVVLVWEVPLWGKPDQVCVMMQLIGLLSELDPHLPNRRQSLAVGTKKQAQGEKLTVSIIAHVSSFCLL
ncbi:hypothetical protein PIIN_09269 [Serendipita indica DSM 11827]|uniref:Uncharacterized protein n=1 Tax=Serendipita indica (strain DSM 11827) TaxID=1109443 RepID=G4TVE2_SERID|nr:hypothetical protein PIIN_09269 [Serendipita indica DSM 11827]